MLQNHHLGSPRGYTPFREDEMEVTRQTTEARVNVHDKNVSDEGASGIVAACGSAHN